MASRIHRLTDLIARILGKDWDQRAQSRRRSTIQPQTGRNGSRGQSDAGPGPLPQADPRLRHWPAAESVPADQEDEAAPGDRSAQAHDAPASQATGPHRAGPSATLPGPAEAQDDDGATGTRPPAEPPAQTSGLVQAPGSEVLGEPLGGAKAAVGLTLNRVQDMITGPMGYAVRRHIEEGHPCLLGSWDDFPFVIEIPQGHEGWLLVSGDWQDPAPASQRDEVAASANDWNRDKFFPTVGIIDGPMGPRVRATYMMDMSSGVTDDQLRLHLNTALSACTQALSAVGPLLPEI